MPIKILPRKCTSVAKEGKVFEPKKLLIPLLDTSEGTKITGISLFLTSPTPTVYSSAQPKARCCSPGIPECFCSPLSFNCLLYFSSCPFLCSSHISPYSYCISILLFNSSEAFCFSETSCCCCPNCGLPAHYLCQGEQQCSFIAEL